ncbi:MAG TPA: hypothetical protein VEJ47_00100 [Candidatus Eremiobacteraceae bacterium]|nr:hypothetical protein [Candidatus Eremiobacteraceae bacterium]
MNLNEIDQLAERLIRDYRSRRNAEIKVLADAIESENSERYDVTVEEYDSPPPRFFVVANQQGEFLAGWVGGRPVWRENMDAAEIFHVDHPKMREALALPEATTLPAPWWRREHV